MKKVCVGLIFGLFVQATAVSGQLIRMSRPSSTTVQMIKSLYRKPNKKESALLAPKPADLSRYRRYLERPGTGLVKLMPDLGCGENPQVLVATPICRRYTMPGGGAAYSFRKQRYRIWRLADLLHKDGIIHAVGIRSQGILVTLGDVPLENVSLRTAAVRFLIEFQPETEFEDAKKQNRKLLEGITRNGFYYRKALRAVENTTYVLRSVAYRGRFYRAVGGVVYNELDYDKRRDVIIAFRIVRQDSSDGSITLLWKELANRKSPKLKVNQELVNEDF